MVSSYSILLKGVVVFVGSDSVLLIAPTPVLDPKPNADKHKPEKGHVAVPLLMCFASPALVW